LNSPNGLCGCALNWTRQPGSSIIARAFATQALLRADLELAENVMAELEHNAPKVARIETDALKLLALQAPVAGDLRAVFGALKNAADVERMHALVLHVAEVARWRYPDNAVPEELNGCFAETGRIAFDLGKDVTEVVLCGNPAKAAQLGLDDDAMDDLHRHLFTVLRDQKWKHGVATAVDVTLLGRYFERFADHAVQIGRRVIYQATGSVARGARR
jgi:phosphate transport system protein